jgi:Domain of unknown function (DUF4484)
MSSPELSRQFPRAGVRATQRDAERYAILREGLKPFPASIVEQPTSDGNEDDGGEAVVDDDGASTISTASTVHDRREIVEPASWSQVAYTSLLWWASAGDRRAGLTEAEEAESGMDLALLDPGDDSDDGKTKEIVLVGFFRRLTGVMFDAAADVIRVADGEYQDEEARESEETAVEDGDGGDADTAVSQQTGEEDEQQRLLPQQQESGDGDGEVEFTSDDMSAMGLDHWSASDKKFLEGFVHAWWGRKAKIRGGHIECCGMKIL